MDVTRKVVRKTCRKESPGWGITPTPAVQKIYLNEVIVIEKIIGVSKDRRKAKGYEAFWCGTPYTEFADTIAEAYERICDKIRRRKAYLSLCKEIYDKRYNTQ